jgi:hypothetical protein
MFKTPHQPIAKVIHRHGADAALVPTCQYISGCTFSSPPEKMLICTGRYQNEPDNRPKPSKSTFIRNATSASLYKCWKADVSSIHITNARAASTSKERREEQKLRKCNETTS